MMVHRLKFVFYSRSKVCHNQMAQPIPGIKSEEETPLN